MRSYLLIPLFSACVFGADPQSASDQYGRQHDAKIESQSKRQQMLLPGTEFNEITLNSGEIIRGAKFLNAGDAGASFAIGTSIKSIPYQSLPDSIALPAINYANWRINSDRERTVKQIAVEQKKREKKEALEQERLRASEASRIAELEAAEKQAERNVNTRDGLKLSRLRADMASAIVTMENVTDRTVTFNWRTLKSRFRGGSQRDATECISNDNQFGYEVPPKGKRTFQVGFGSRRIGDGNWLEDVAWVDGQWFFSVR